MATKTYLLAAFAAVAVSRSCENITIPITISAQNAVFGNLAIPTAPFGPTDVILDIIRTGGSPVLASTGTATVGGAYEISAQICSPEKGSGDVLQLLTHGIGFDKAYWDLAYDDYSYSYVDTALSYGYSVLYYDRLGIGQSSHGNPLDEIQAFLEVEALAEITRQVREGTIPGCNKKFSKIIHFGHSFGSVQTAQLSSQYPELTDGIVLTGFSTDGSFIPLFASGSGFETAKYNQPSRLGSPELAAPLDSVLSPDADPGIINTYGLTDYYAKPDTFEPLDYPDGYWVSRDTNNLVFDFLLPGHFDPEIAYYAESGKQPVTVGELLTIGSIANAPSMYPGPVLVFTGSADLPFCGSNCYAPAKSGRGNIVEATKALFPNASAFEAYIQPDTAHGLTLHYNATAGYEYINDWLEANVL